MSEVEKTIRLPADWEPHRRSWVVWPHKEAPFGESIGKVKVCIEHLVNTILHYERVTIVTHPDDFEGVSNLFEKDGREGLDIEVFSTDVIWARDLMPLFLKGVEDHSIVARSWHFDSWGSAQNAELADNSLSEWFSSFLSRSGDVDSFDFVEKLHDLGSIQSDGEGTLLVTKQNMIGDMRKGSLTEDEIDALLKRELGAKKVIWLDQGIWGDNLTQGHVSGLASFACPGVVLTMSSEDIHHPNYDAFVENRKILESDVDALGRSLKIIEIPQPMTVFWEEKALPLSYVNYYPVDGAILVPIFNDPHDEKAIEVYASLFEDRDIIPVDVLSFYRNGGGLHSLFAPQPKI